MLLLGDFDDAAFAIGKFQVLIKLLFFASSILGILVLLNLLIARMSDSYARIQEEAEKESCRLQATIIQKYEMIFQKTGDHPWLHIVQPIEENTDGMAKAEFAGAVSDRIAKTAAI